jgi:rhodanese-related sulfurtransferase
MTPNPTIPQRPARRRGRTDGARRTLLLAACAAALALPAIARAQAQQPAAPKVDLETARAAAAAGQALLIDIREPDEHAATGVAPGALRLPLSQIKERQSEIPRDPARPVLLICRTQNRSSKLATMLQAQGYTNVRYVDGGMKEWTERHFPTEMPPR